ncbi:MAG TPA: MFS transporter [Ktedonobacteraceae bacterium]|jgi:MFS family permease|nr:MFS transporter [Ktedonobacteraceae bacterium]
MSTTNDAQATTNKQPSRRRSLWRNRDYLLLTGGQMVSNLGSQVSHLAFPLFVLAVTGSPAQAGFVGALHVLPYLFLSLPAGALVDRWDRKRVMLLCDTGRAICLASIPLAYAFGWLTIWQLYLVSLLEGTLFVFFNLAEIGGMLQVVAKEQISAAAAQNMVTESVAYLIGPAIGGALYSFGRIVPFLTDAISYIASVGSLLCIKTRFQLEREPRKISLWKDIHEGLVWLWNEPLIFFMALRASVLNIAVAGIAIIVIIIAQHLHASPFVIGLILALDGVGSILGGLLANLVYRRVSFRVITIASSWICTIFWPLMVIVPDLALLAIALGILLLVLSVYDVAQLSYRLSLIPDELQGRVNSVYRMLLFAGDTLGLVLVGILIQTIGTATTMLVYGGLIFIVTLVTTLNPRVRHAQPQAELLVK